MRILQAAQMIERFFRQSRIVKRQLPLVTRSAFVAIATWAAFHATVAKADLMSIGTGLTLTWDHAAQPTVSNYLTIPILNGNTSDPRQLSSWSVAIRVVAEPGAIGTVSISSGTISYASNEVISSPFPSTHPQTQSLNIPSGDLLVAATNLSGQDSVPASGANMFKLQFTASANASGVFDLQVFNNSGGLWTYWADADNNIFPFANAPADALSTVNIGTISVATPTPEPGTLLLALVGTAGLSGYRWHRRKRG